MAQKMIAAWLLAFAGLLSFWGLGWDIQWHADVGPDTFWTAPHGLIYGGTAIGGFVSLYMIILTTIKHRRGVTGIEEQNSSFLGFKGQMGYIIAGFGSLVFILGGAYDEWWHSLYGFDVTLFSPSHFGLFFSSMIARLGGIYVFVSESNQAKHRGDRKVQLIAGIGFCFSMALFLTTFTPFLIMAVTQKMMLGPFIDYAIVSTILFSAALFMIASFIRRTGFVTLTALFFTLLNITMYYGAPWGVERLASAMGYSYKVEAIVDPILSTSMPMFLFVMAIVIDLLMFLGYKQRAVKIKSATIMLFASAAGLIQYFLEPRWKDIVKMMSRTSEQTEIALQQLQTGAIPTLFMVAVLGAVLGYIGWKSGAVFRYTNK
ncbi:hypothetical protein [Paenibacillus beijingensis]|uniref:hypothetical protein n=1 Tax=Paenibacillus beijingensis TaxID=1126833 RepID=UPI0006967BD1|nr:hypothetical protein [Paenibacillus beijingensis]